VGSVLEIRVNGLSNFTVNETVTSRSGSVVNQRETPMTVADGIILDCVCIGREDDEPLSYDDARDTILSILANPRTQETTQTLTISVAGRVVATAEYNRTLTNVDETGNLRSYVNRGRSIVNFTIELSPLTFRRVP